MDLYIKVRRAVMVENMSEREAARRFEIHRKAVKKISENGLKGLKVLSKEWVT